MWNWLRNRIFGSTCEEKEARLPIAQTQQIPKKGWSLLVLQLLSLASSAPALFSANAKWESAAAAEQGAPVSLSCQKQAKQLARQQSRVYCAA